MYEIVFVGLMEELFVMMGDLVLVFVGVVLVFEGDECFVYE